MNIAVIPARGGSKRIPRKNIIDFFGHPMIAHTISAAIDSQLFDIVAVSTDDQEIATYARDYNAQVVIRPDSLGQNHVGVSEVVAHAGDKLRRENRTRGSQDTVCMLMANCPLRTRQDIIGSFDAFRQDNTAQISVVPFQGVHPQWAMTRSESGTGHWVQPPASTTSQDLATTYCPTGAIWWSPLDRLLQTKTFYSPGFRLFTLDSVNGWDIDDFADLRIAKLFMHGLYHESGTWPLNL